MDNVVETLVDEMLTLQAEVAALRVMAGASVVDDPINYINTVVANIDAYTLPMVMSDGQREVLRARLEYTRDLWVAHMRETRPGGWRGLRYWLGRTLKRLHLVFVGSGEPETPPTGSWDWSKLVARGVSAPNQP